MGTLRAYDFSHSHAVSIFYHFMEENTTNRRFSSTNLMQFPNTLINKKKVFRIVNLIFTKFRQFSSLYTPPLGFFLIFWLPKKKTKKKSARWMPKWGRNRGMVWNKIGKKSISHPQHLYIPVTEKICHIVTTAV